ncbi:hypothetical protein I317_05430 [Kwoniella heveanensis CBS 569]|nr:hypothetical protein I317_05430 [Kwoniella heveanensis CBS 569]
MSTTIPIPLPFDKGRDLPPHLDSNAYYEDSSPGASSSSTPVPYHPSPLASRAGPHPLAADSDQIDDEPGEEENIFRDMNFEEILEDLNARFLINLPKEEMSLVRVYWQAEQAHWFYEDYLRPLNPLLPSLSQRNFTRIIIESSPLYVSLMNQGGVDYDQLWEDYCSYKRMVPCCGGILINKDGDKCLMVRGYKSNAGWSFPRGKINLEESEEACAIREVEEETGFDLSGLIDPSDKIKTHINAQEVTMFIIKGIDEGTIFKTQTRNEIGAIEWVRLMDLPTWMNKKGPKRTGGSGQKKFYNVTPFVNPLKQWLKKNNIDPYMKPKKKNQPQSQYRDLQPYHFDSPSPQPASPALSKGSSALDDLFARFVHKQTEELNTPVDQAVVGSDNKAGLERLFGNLNVLKEEEESLTNKYEGDLTDKEREKKEDDALARLLGGLGGLQTPAPEAPKPTPATQRQANILAVLNQRPAPATTFLQHSHDHSHATPTPAKPHQAKLLAMIAPPTASVSSTASLPAKPMSLPTSPRPPTPLQGAEEAERQAKARALLDMTIAGIGIDMPVNAAHQMEQLNQSHPAFLPPLPQPGSAGRTSNASGGSSNSAHRITPPGSHVSMPPIHQIQPPSSYSQHSQNQSGYRPISQPPHTVYTTSSRQPPVNQGQSGFGDSPHRSSQPPPPPYDALNHVQSRGASGVDTHAYTGTGGYDTSRGVPNMPTLNQPSSHSTSGGPTMRPPHGPLGVANSQAQQSFRPTSNPLPGPGSYGQMGYGAGITLPPGVGVGPTTIHQGPHAPHHHLPPSGLQGGFVPPPGSYPGAQQSLAFRPPGPVLAGGLMIPQPQGPSAGIHQSAQPFSLPMALHTNFSSNGIANGQQRNSPPKSHHPVTVNNPNVFHPVPRPPAGQSSALLAMINGGERSQGR